MTPKIIVFSKDRPMQLTAYLDSLFFWGGTAGLQVVVIYRDNGGDYQDIIKKYPNVWFRTDQEVGFDSVLRSTAEMVIRSDDSVLFGVDDVVWTHPIPWGVMNLLHEPEYEKVLGFHMYLGSNITHGRQGLRPVDARPPFIRWNWTEMSIGTHWGYCFAVSASVYRGGLISDVIKSFPSGRIVGPNSFEGAGVQYVHRTYRHQPQALCLNGPSRAVVYDLNRVQDVAPNPIRGGPEHTAENLLKLYRQGYRIDWRNAAWATPDDVFVGSKYFSLTEGHR